MVCVAYDCSASSTLVILVVAMSGIQVCIMVSLTPGNVVGLGQYMQIGVLAGRNPCPKPNNERKLQVGLT